MSILNFKELESYVKTLKPVKTAVAAAADVDVIGSLKAGRELGFLGTCYLTGDKDKITKAITDSGDDPSQYEIIHAANDAEAGILAVKAVRENNAAILVKGSLKSALYLKAMLDKEKGLRASSMLSNLTLFEMASYHKFLAITDNAISILPTLDDKKAIIENTRPLWKALGVEQAKVAALAAVETVSSKMQATVDAGALSTMFRRGQMKGFIVDGPLGYDAAIDRECAQSKGIDSPVCGDPDMILCPNLETANSLAKSYKFHGGATWGGLVFGATVPAVLNSRSDDSRNRLNSMMIARAIAEVN